MDSFYPLVLSYAKDPWRLAGQGISANKVSYWVFSRKLGIRIPYEKNGRYNQLLLLKNNLYSRDMGTSTIRILESVWATILSARKLNKIASLDNLCSFCAEIVKNPRKDVRDWFMALDFPREDQGALLVRISFLEGSDDYFLYLLKRFHSEGLILSSSDSRLLFGNLLRDQNFEGIKELTRLCEERPQFSSMFELRKIRTKEALEVVTSFFKISANELGREMTSRGIWMNTFDSDVSLETINLYLEDLGLLPLGLFEILTKPLRVRGEALRKLLGVLDNPLRLFLSNFLWNLLNQKGTDQELQILLETYGNLKESYRFDNSVVKDKIPRALDEGAALNLSTPLRIQTFLGVYLQGNPFTYEDLYNLVNHSHELSPGLLGYPEFLKEILRIYEGPKEEASSLLERLFRRGLKRVPKGLPGLFGTRQETLFASLEILVKEFPNFIKEVLINLQRNPSHEGVHSFFLQELIKRNFLEKDKYLLETPVGTSQDPEERMVLIGKYQGTEIDPKGISLNLQLVRK